MRADGEMTKDQYREKSATDRASLENLEAELNVQRAKARAVDTTQGARIAKAVQTLIAGRTRLTGDQKRSILRSVVRRVDVDAAPTGALQARVEGGRLAKGSFPRWRIDRVTLQLAIPKEAQCEGSGHRDRHLATNFFSCGREAVAVEHAEGDHAGCRDGHLATTSSCSDRLGQGRR
jgi:hypothetical protein